MIDQDKKRQKAEQIQKTRRRMHAVIDPENYEYKPEKKPIDYYDNDVRQNVGIYVRVSTDDVRQTTSYELQKIYYEDFVRKHPHWTLYKIYADEGISGTSLKHRDAFMKMIGDAKAGKINLIVTKSVSRFARNVEDFIRLIRELRDLNPPVCVFFESESISSLNEDQFITLTMLATMADEESHTRSRSMETSLRMRLDNGLPLTPKLLGYTHDSEGNLVINPEEAPTVKLTFYMYLYGYSSQQIADTLIALERKSYLGNIKWTSGSVVQILRNERHCGDVVTRKTYTKDYHSHKKSKNYGQRPQSTYRKHHEGIVSRDDFIAVQRMLDNAKYGNKSVLPELRVIDSGILRGFVTINPRWSGFKEPEYYQASRSVYLDSNPAEGSPIDEIQVSVEAGDFDLRGFEISRAELFDVVSRPVVTFQSKKIKFSTECVRKFGANNYVELLINPVERKFAVRSTDKQNRSGVYFSKIANGIYYPKDVPAGAYGDTIYSLFGWNKDYKYRIIGYLYEQDGEVAYLFDAADCEAYLKSYVLSKHDSANGEVAVHPLTPSGKHIRAIPKEWTENFGKPFYVHEQSLEALARQSEAEWKLRIEGQLFETGKKVSVTSFDELRQYIQQELSDVTLEEINNERIR